VLNFSILDLITHQHETTMMTQIVFELISANSHVPNNIAFDSVGGFSRESRPLELWGMTLCAETLDCS
jgi:hypothetical protein